MDTYCTVAECEAPTREGRIRCDFHEKRHQRGQPLTAPKAERLTPKARLLEAAIRLADAETDEDYAKAERDTLKAARQLSPSALGELVRQGMAHARQRGVRLGHPPRVTYGDAMRAVSQHGSLKAAVRAGVASRNALRRALRRGPESGIANPSRHAKVAA
jgi:hypothetical protein